MNDYPNKIYCTIEIKSNPANLNSRIHVNFLSVILLNGYLNILTSGLKPNYINLVLACLISKLIIYMKLLQRSLLAVYLNQRLSIISLNVCLQSKSGCKDKNYFLINQIFREKIFNFFFTTLFLT